MQYKSQKICWRLLNGALEQAYNNIIAQHFYRRIVFEYSCVTARVIHHCYYLVLNVGRVGEGIYFDNRLCSKKYIIITKYLLKFNLSCGIIIYYKFCFINFILNTGEWIV